MKSLLLSTRGTILGTAVGALSLLIASAGLLLSGTIEMVPTAVVVSAIGGSTIAGAGGVLLGCLVTRHERTWLTVLMTMAVAALVVLMGNYSNGSPIPAMIYSMAIINGLAIARALGPLCSADNESGRSFLS